MNGDVVDLQGKPIRNARVTAIMQGVVFASAISYVTADGQGAFSIENLNHGNYTVAANNESDGYPDNSFEFYSNHLEPRLDLSATTAYRDG